MERAGRWSARLGAGVAGAIASLAFPEPGWWWLGWVGLAPIFVVIAVSPDRREALWRAWAAGTGFLTALHYWLLAQLGVFAPLVAVFVGLFWLPLGPTIRWFARGERRVRWLGVLVVPSVWVVIEWIRSWEYLAGSWGVWGLTQWQVVPIAQTAALGGVWLLSYLAVATNVALALAIRATGKRDRLVAVGIALAIPVVLAIGGSVRNEPGITDVIRIAGVQPGVFESPTERLDAHIALTRSIEPSTYDLVVWGQSSVALDPWSHPDMDEALRSVAATAGTDVFVNVDAETERGITKSLVQYTARGPAATYAKRRLVPFGEYIPLRPLLGWIDDVTEAADRDRVRGEAATTIRSAGLEIGPLISYESTFPDMRRELAALGADMTVVQGSSWTFQGTWAQPQQASFEAVRAIESGRPAVLVAVSGTSAAFDARGRELLWIPADTTGAFVVDVPISREETLYVRLGDWVVWLSIGVCAAAAAAPLVRRLVR